MSSSPWSSLADQRAAIVRAAARSGCRVLSIGDRATSVGDYCAASLDCPTPWHGARLLVAMADEDAETAGARDHALELRHASATDDDYTRAVFERGQALRFIREPGEVFAMGSFTLDRNAGDCDDHARAVYALLRAGGAPARIVFLHEPGGDPSHAVTQGMIGGRWTWLETTLPAALGEHPMSAAKRLGVVRADLALDSSTLDPRHLERKVPVLGALKLAGALTAAQIEHFEQAAYTRDLSPAFFRGVAEVARRFRLLGADVTGEDLLAVLNGETGVRPHLYGPKKPDGTCANGDGLWDYGMNGIHAPAGLRMVGWTGTPEEFIALDAADQLPYVERYFVRVLSPSSWPSIKGARGLYAINAWPSLAALSSNDLAVLGAKGSKRGAYYTAFDPQGKGYNVSTDIDAWIGKRQRDEGARWIEIRERYWIESGEVPTRPLTLGGAVKTTLFLGACGALGVWLARDA